MDRKIYSDIKLKTLDTTDDYVDIEGLASVAVADRDGEVVDLSGLDLSNYMKNPIILYQHDRTQPIGKALDIKVNGNSLFLKARIFKNMNEQAYYGVKNGVLKSFSIGFRALDGKFDDTKNVFIFTKAELFEVSIVSVPANPEAVFQVVKDIDGECKGLCVLKLQKLKINDDKFSTTPWGDVDKTELHNKLYEMGDKKAIDEAYLYVGDYEKVTTWCCPHHEIVGNELLPNINGIEAAYAALNGARGNKPDIPEEAIKKAKQHLKKHYLKAYELGLIKNLPDEFKKDVDMNREKGIENQELTLDNIIQNIEKETRLSADVITKILLFLNFSIFKEDGTFTTFASKYGISKSNPYEDLYKVLKQIKDEYKSDKEFNAFGVLLKDLGLSTISRASAWIYKTYQVRQQGTTQDKLLTARTFAESWFFRTFGLTTDNLLKFKSVVKAIDKYQDVMTDFVSGQTYKPNTNKKDVNVEVLEKQIEQLTQFVKELREELKQKQQLSVVEYFKALDAETALKEFDEVSKIVNEKIKSEIEGE